MLLVMLILEYNLYREKEKSIFLGNKVSNLLLYY